MHYETGSALILILVLLALISGIGIHLGKQNLFMYQKIKRFSHEIKQNLLLEAELKDLEEAWLENFNPLEAETLRDKSIGDKKTGNKSIEDERKIPKQTFIADHLEFGCGSGMLYCPFSKKQYQSYLRVAWQNSLVQPDFKLMQESILPKVISKLKKDLGSKARIEDMLWLSPPKMKRPAEAYKGFAEFLKKHSKRIPSLFFLVSAGNEKKAQLWQIDAKTGDEMTIFTLPLAIEKGHLWVEDVYYDQNWHSILIIQVEEKLKSQVFILDATNPKQIDKQALLSPLLSSTQAEKFIILSKPKLICSKKGEWKLMLAGKLLQEEIIAGAKQVGQGVISAGVISTNVINPSAISHGAICLISLDSQKTQQYFKMEHHLGLVTILPLDFKQQGFLDKLYTIDEGGNLWCNAIKDIARSRKISTGYALVNIKKIYALASENGKIEFLALQKGGVEGDLLLRFLAKPSAINEGFDQIAFKKEVLAKGQFLDFFVFAGVCIVVPATPNQDPLLFLQNKPNYEKIASSWNTLGLGNLPYVKAELFWDLKQKQLRLFLLNAAAELKVLELKLNANPVNARVVFRKKFQD